MRGEVYWVSVDDSVGCEIRTGRPAVIISGDGENSTSETVIVAYLTQSDVKKWSRVVCYVNGVSQTVCCEQLRTVDKKRLSAYKGRLTKEDMLRVTGALASAMCIPLKPNVPEQKPEPAEIRKLKVELDMYKGMYELVLQQLISQRVSADLGYSSDEEEYEDSEYEEEYEEESVEEESVEEAEEEPAEVEEIEEEPEKPDINTCQKSDLVKIGVNWVTAQTIVANRPYATVSDLRRVPGVTKVAFRILKSKVVCVVEPREESEGESMLNINTASAKEIKEFTGIGLSIAYKITGYRGRNGNYKSLEELANVPYLPKHFLEKFRDKLTVGEECR